MSRGHRILLVAALAAGIAGFTDSGLEDPTRPAFASRSAVPVEPTEPGRLVLRSVLVSERDRVAEINDRRVRVGGRVAGHRVLDIDVSGVRLAGPDGETLLTLSGGGFKKPSPAERSTP